MTDALDKCLTFLFSPDSDHRPRLARYPDTQAPGPAVDNFRDFADIKQERLFNIYRSKLRNRRIEEKNYY